MRKLRTRLTTLACLMVDSTKTGEVGVSQAQLREVLIRTADELIEPELVVGPPLGMLLEMASDAAIPWIVDEVLEVALDPRRRAEVLNKGTNLVNSTRERIAKRRAARRED